MKHLYPTMYTIENVIFELRIYETFLDLEKYSKTMSGTLVTHFQELFTMTCNSRYKTDCMSTRDVVTDDLLSRNLNL